MTRFLKASHAALCYVLQRVPCYRAACRAAVLPCCLLCHACRAVILMQSDVTARVHMERALADLTEAQLQLLEQIYPRHIIEHMVAGG